MLEALVNYAVRRSRAAIPSPASIRFATTRDADAINALYNDASARPDAAAVPPRTAAQWRWEYIQSSSDSPPYVLAEHDGYVVGTQAYIPIEFVCDGRIIRTGKDEDTLVHPVHRGRGLLDAMYKHLSARALSDGVELLWGLTSTAVKPLIRNGFMGVGVNDAMAATQWTVAPVSISGLIVSEINEPGADSDLFSLELSRHLGGIMPHLTASFLKWRVFENPFRRYQMVEARLNGRLVGLAIFKLDERKQVGFISDLVAIPAERISEADILSALLDPGLRHFAREGYRRVEARPSGTHPFNRRVQALLSTIGFIRQSPDQAATFLVRPMLPSARSFLALDQWRISELMREY
ncbi:MAG: GNAT family N-acetyltransferase [Planctomycetes bacterium]|nr:GNAT family N-acetyltransferase [Planctomycetota bacterium]